MCLMTYNDLNEVAMATISKEISADRASELLKFYIAAEKQASVLGYVGVGVISFSEQNLVIFQTNPENYEGWDKV